MPNKKSNARRILRLSDKELAVIGLSIFREALSVTSQPEVSIEDVDAGIGMVMTTLDDFLKSPFTVIAPKVDEFIYYFQSHNVEETALWVYEKVTGGRLSEQFHDYYIRSSFLLWSIEHVGLHLNSGCHSRKSNRYNGVFGVLIKKLEEMLLENVYQIFGISPNDSIPLPPKLRRSEALTYDGYLSYLEMTVVDLLDLREGNINKADPLDIAFYHVVSRDPYILFLAKSSAPDLDLSQLEQGYSFTEIDEPLGSTPMSKPRFGK